MKRSGPPLRRKALKRTGGPKRRRRPVSLSERQRHDEWKRGVLGQLCAVCRSLPAQHGHHILRAQVLRREAVRLGYDLQRVLWDKRNRLPICSLCHERHHKGRPKIELALIRRRAPKALQFAHELGLAHALERDYG